MVCIYKCVEARAQDQVFLLMIMILVSKSNFLLGLSEYNKLMKKALENIQGEGILDFKTIVGHTKQVIRSNLNGSLWYTEYFSDHLIYSKSP